MRRDLKNPITEYIPNDDIEDNEVDSEPDEAVRLFKQKIRRLEKAAKSGQLDVADQNEAGGVWLNNLNSLNQGPGSGPSSGIDGKEKKISGSSSSSGSGIPGLDQLQNNLNGNIVIPPPLEGYEKRIEEMLKKEQKIQEEILKIQNEDNVLKQITSEVDMTSPATESKIVETENQSGIKLTQSVVRDFITDKNNNKNNADLGPDSEENSTEDLPREMLLTKRGYQVKKLENLKAGFSKKVRFMSFILFSDYYFIFHYVFHFS